MAQPRFDKLANGGRAAQEPMGEPMIVDPVDKFAGHSEDNPDIFVSHAQTMQLAPTEVNVPSIHGVPFVNE